MKTFHSLRIVFFGTPEFAVASLDALVKADAKIVAVVTAPDKPAGRGRQISESAVKKYAVAKNIPVLQPEKMKSQEFLSQLKDLNADLQIVVAFRMMPEVVWNMPPMGTINVHGSLLPQYRGAAPINRAIMNGETETGVTTFKLKHEIDTGDILLQKVVPILPNDNAGTLHDKMMIEGATLLVETVKGLASNTIKEIPQMNVATNNLKHAPKIFRQDMEIDWNKPYKTIINQIRGLSPYPTAHTALNGKVLKIYNASVNLDTPTKEPGSTIITSSKLLFACIDGWISIEDLQIEGKKRMLTVDFLKGYRGNSN